jgi:hypothetical protein
LPDAPSKASSNANPKHAEHGYWRHKSVYLKVLLGYALFGIVMLSHNPGALITCATMFYNIALGVSCWHTLRVNLTLLPPALRPR